MMTFDASMQTVEQWYAQALQAISEPTTYIQVILVIAIYFFSFWVIKYFRSKIPYLSVPADASAHPLRKLLFQLGTVFAPLLALFLVKIADEIALALALPHWLMQTTLAIAFLVFFRSVIKEFVLNPFAARLFSWIGLPLVFLQIVGLLTGFIEILESISINIGNMDISAYGVFRVLIFGSFLFWLGRVSNSFGKAVIKNQEKLDVPTKEIFSKLFEVVLFCIIVLLLLNVMGINLTTLAVFGGAIGVGIGLGLQSIASNFISGIIILLDRSLTIDDYVELDGGPSGFVREFKMRYAVLETYDGKDVLVPNEKFISDLLINWSHKDPKQRYRVDFSVPYSTDIRPMVEFIKVAVAEHPQVLSGLDSPLEERPDCEIDSFGDSGVNMFVEFWMLGIDDGKNRVGGDLLLTIFETLKANGIEIPFPQREVRILNSENPNSHKSVKPGPYNAVRSG
jgi:small-conductance mechanosensitive channel